MLWCAEQVKSRWNRTAITHGSAHILVITHFAGTHSGGVSQSTRIHRSAVVGCKQQALLDEGFHVSRDTCGFTLSYRTASVSSQWQWQMEIESVVQSKSTRSRSSVVTKWMGDRYVLVFAPALRFLRSQILCRLHKSPSDETVSRVPPPPLPPPSPVSIRMQKDHIHMLKIL